jgi:hypothetical protein
MKIRRDISSIPQRSADGTWDSIIKLITGPESIDGEQLEAARGVITSLITDELYEKHPFTLVGGSHRLVIYLFYRQNSIENGDNIDALTWNPTEKNWILYVPCDDGNFDWAQKILIKKAPRLKLHALNEMPGEESDSEKKSTNAETLKIDWGAFS